MRVDVGRLMTNQRVPYAFSVSSYVDSSLTKNNAVKLDFVGMRGDDAASHVPFMSAPFMLSSASSFVCMKQLIDVLGMHYASQIAQMHHVSIKSTTTFKQTKFYSVDELIEVRPDLLETLQIPAEELFSNPLVLDALRVSGFDCAIYADGVAPKAILFDEAQLSGQKPRLNRYSSPLPMGSDWVNEGTTAHDQLLRYCHLVRSTESMQDTVLGDTDSLVLLSEIHRARVSVEQALREWLNDESNVGERLTVETTAGSFSLSNVPPAAIAMPAAFDGHITRPRAVSDTVSSFLDVVEAGTRRVKPQPLTTLVYETPAPVTRPVRRGVTPNVGWMTTAEVKDEVVAMGLGSLLDNNTLVVHETSDQLPDSVQKKNGVVGLFSADGIIHIVAGRIRRSQGLLGTLLHEGFHGAVPVHLGDKSWSSLLDDIGMMYQAVRDGEHQPTGYWADAMRSIDDLLADEPDMPWALQVEEFAAYAISHRMERPAVLTAWVSSAFGFAQSWLRKSFGVQLGDISADQLVHLSRSALRAVAASDDPTLAMKLTPMFAKRQAFRPERKTEPAIRLMPITILGRLQQAFLAKFSLTDDAYTPDSVFMRSVKPSELLAEVPRQQRIEGDLTTVPLVAHGQVIGGLNALQEARKHDQFGVIDCSMQMTPAEAHKISQAAVTMPHERVLSVLMKPPVGEQGSPYSHVADALYSVANALSVADMANGVLPQSVLNDDMPISLSWAPDASYAAQVPHGYVAVSVVVSDDPQAAYDDALSGLRRCASHAADAGCCWRTDGLRHVPATYSAAGSEALAVFASNHVVSPHKEWLHGAHYDVRHGDTLGEPS